MAVSPAAVTPEPPASLELRVPLFGTLIRRFESGVRRVTLDLGMPRAATVDLLGGFSGRLDIAALPAALDRINAFAGDAHPDRLLEAELPPAGGELTDVVLCWDLLNYLQLPVMEALMSRLVARARHGTVLHALIYYSAPRMPPRPGRYAPIGAERLLAVPAGGESVEAPRYSPKQLEKHMHGFRADQAMLLNNGMQEFLFRLERRAQ